MQVTVKVNGEEYTREIEPRLNEASPRYLTLDQVRQRLEHFSV